MRLHRNLCFAVIDGLLLIFNEGKYADKVIQKLLKRDKRWGSRDRGFVAETTYDIVRWKRLYAEIAQVKEPFSRDDAWRLFAVWATLKGIKLPDWKYFEGTPSRKIKGRFDELSKDRKFRESVPDWIDELGVKELGESKWTKELAMQNKQADVILRVNTLKTTKSDLKLKLESVGIETLEIKGYPYALQLKERANVFTTEAFKDGWFEVQDASSQLVADFLDVKPGMKVVDSCAGAGGKTLHLSALMENKGSVVAMDIYESKLKKLKIDLTTTVVGMIGSFDKRKGCDLFIETARKMKNKESSWLKLIAVFLVDYFVMATGALMSGVLFVSIFNMAHG